MAEVMVEAHDAMHFGPREIQFPCNQRDACGRHPSEIVLDAPQYRHQRSALVFKPLNDRDDRSLVPWMIERHRNSETLLPPRSSGSVYPSTPLFLTPPNPQAEPH